MCTNLRAWLWNSADRASAGRSAMCGSDKGTVVGTCGAAFPRGFTNKDVRPARLLNPEPRNASPKP
ncbi:hypothetical protein GCM10009527_075070 [Actinomadura nitritigenes]